MESLSDKLKSLGVQLGAGGISAPKRTKKQNNIEQVIPGEAVMTEFGEAYVVESWYDTEYRHGIIHINNQCDLKVITEWGHAPHLCEHGLEQFLFLDTETTGLGGGTGTLAFLIGLGHLTPTGFHLIQLLLRAPQEEPAMLSMLNSTLAQFQAVVTYNGKSFDVPLLNTRHVLNGFPSPFPALVHLDLLPLARRIWRNRLPSRALGDLEVDIVGVHRTQEEVPGYMIPQIYFDYLHTGNAQPLAGVLYHNAMDILSLAALFHHVSHLLSDPLGYTEPQSLDLIAIARLYEDLGQYETAIQLYEHSLEMGMPEYFFLQTLQRFAELYRKRGEWQQTVNLWEKAAEHRQIEACIELAKYYEHQQRDCLQALAWTEKASELVNATIRGLASRQQWHTVLTHRSDRLTRKISTVNKNGAAG